MTIPRSLTRKHKWISEWSILLCYRGSITHGTYLPKSLPNSIDDKDVLSVVVPDEGYYFGLGGFGSRGTKELFEGEWDIVGYEARKMVRLLAKGNPNVLSSLWLPDKHYIKVEDAGRMLIENRSLFATKKVYHSFTGYAHSQLHKMESFTKEGYMGQKRKALVDKFGYDCKNAAHLIRLLRMGIEFLVQGELTVERPDAQEILAIKQGRWPIEKVKEEADRLFQDAKSAFIHSGLPTGPDMDAINLLCVDIVRAELKRRGDI